MTEERCVCCGAVIPDGRQVCPLCSEKVKEERENRKPRERHPKRRKNRVNYSKRCDIM